MSEVTVLQPQQIFSMFKIKVQSLEEAERILDVALKLLVYLNPGDKLKSGGITYTKISEDLVHVDVKVKAEEIGDLLERKKVIRVAT